MCLCAFPIMETKSVTHSIYYLNRGSALSFHSGIWVQLLKAELCKILSKLKVLPGFSPCLDLHLEPAFYSLTIHWQCARDFLYLFFFSVYKTTGTLQTGWNTTYPKDTAKSERKRKEPTQYIHVNLNWFFFPLNNVCFLSTGVPFDEAAKQLVQLSAD